MYEYGKAYHEAMGPTSCLFHTSQELGNFLVYVLSELNGEFYLDESCHLTFTEDKLLEAFKIVKAFTEAGVLPPPALQDLPIQHIQRTRELDELHLQGRDIECSGDELEDHIECNRNCDRFRRYPQLRYEYGVAGKRTAGDRRRGHCQHERYDDGIHDPGRGDRNGVDLSHAECGGKKEYGRTGHEQDLSKRNAEINDPLIYPKILLAAFDIRGESCGG